MSLRDDLTEIRGIGDAKATQILEVVNANSDSLSEEDVENLRNGIDYVESGQPSYAMKFFDRVDL